MNFQAWRIVADINRRFVEHGELERDGGRDVDSRGAVTQRIGEQKQVFVLGGKEGGFPRRRWKENVLATAFHFIEAAGEVLRVDTHQQLRVTRQRRHHIADPFHDEVLSGHVVRHPSRVEQDGPRWIGPNSSAEALAVLVKLRTEMKIELRRPRDRYLLSADVGVDAHELAADGVVPDKVMIVRRQNASLRCEIIPGEQESRGRYVEPLSGLHRLDRNRAVHVRRIEHE